MPKIIVGIDIGTSKVSTVIGKIINNGEVAILGKSSDICSGVKKGIIIDIDATANSIQNSVKKAEAEANIKVTSAYVNISGLHVDIINHKNYTSISAADKEITSQDIDKLLYSAGTIPISEDCEIIDVVPRQFIVDGYDGIHNPVGMKGTRLEGDFDVVIGKIISVQNIVRSMKKASIKVDGLVAEAFATSECILLPDEKDVGVILIDIGAGSTEISVYKNRNLIVNNCIPVGGDHISNDISVALKITFAEAERIKRQLQLALTSLIKNDQEVTVSDISDSFKKNIKVSDAVEIIEARVYEIFSICQEFISNNCPENYGAGVVLVGKGISNLDGAIQIAYDVFGIPVRVAIPKNREIVSMEYCTAVGMLKFIASQEKQEKHEDAEEVGTTSQSSEKRRTTRREREQKTPIKKVFGFLKDLFY